MREAATKAFIFDRLLVVMVPADERMIWSGALEKEEKIQKMSMEK